MYYFDIHIENSMRDSKSGRIIKRREFEVKILFKYKESVPDRTKITVGFGTTGVHISYMPA